ncbi:poly(beta-D-mannuronate) lyase [Catalinimonas alkaloidigena]|uniref:chondroitinase-B domain-containing protein n=1 Tax=Catalinimonas alkaloidigena TaxID=1075417 RepID=UPI002406073E|nr:chondroitinase-B domain-containing protein [Catalinimonas alkaloidigena]MDF9799287.1 poly(beta-D-mannuronate) lyase [Catalinimonas alkaloidigena]
MKNNLLLTITILLLLFSCNKKSNTESIYVKNTQELNQAISQATAGDEIVLANGVWQNVQLKFFGRGTKKKPITLRAETLGEVYIEGQSYLHLGGENLVVSGLYFRNGYTPSNGIIRYKIGADSVANHCRVTSCVIENFTQPNRSVNDQWIEFYGRHNQMDHCYIAGKSNDGTTLMVYHDGNENTNNHHQIVNNYFGPRPPKGGPRAETIRLGGSETQMTPGRVNISNNYFEACNGEVEIISDKTNYNSYKHNIFYKCEGSLVLRHGNYATVDGNIFIGGDESDFYGGIRLVNTGHWITNNYFYKIKGAEFRSPLAIMNGIPMTPLNRYKQVTDAVIAYNSWVDCKSPWQIGIGQNRESVNVLPASEIRSAPPIRTTMANNLIYNTKADEAPLVNHDDMDGILFKNNIIDNNGSEYTAFDVLQNKRIRMKQVNEWLYVPEDVQNEFLNEVYEGYDFGRIQQDLFGASRAEKSRVGAIKQLAAAEAFRIDKKQYGPQWFSPDKAVNGPNVLTASSAEGELANIIAQAHPGDIIELSDELYTIDSPLKIDKEISIRAAGENKVQLVFKGEENTPAFEMHPKGQLTLSSVKLSGNGKNYAFASLKDNMSSLYNLSVKNSEISDFDYVLKAYKYSFSEYISFKSTVIKNCHNGLELSAEDDDQGEYNAENMYIVDCEFEKVGQNVIDYYRGGYDESTVGGKLVIKGSTFTRSGGQEKSGVLINTYGIINVDISNNTFIDNPVELVARLWGAKNNTAVDNTIENSGRIISEHNLPLKLIY